MSPRSRTQPCTRENAKQRLADARAQMELADLATANSGAPERKAAVACACTAAIAASDAACCAALGERSQSENHRDATTLVGQIAPGGDGAAQKLGRLLGLKHEAQYGFGEISAEKLKIAQRNARALIEFAEQVLAR
jgi:hypothetical protein